MVPRKGGEKRRTWNKKTYKILTGEWRKGIPEKGPRKTVRAKKERSRDSNLSEGGLHTEKAGWRRVQGEKKTSI